MTMQWIDENNKDAEMLKRIDLSALDTGLADGNEQLAKKVQRHNKALSDLAQRFDKLANDREELARTDHWLEHDGKTVLAERRRAVTESWDVLVALRKLLRDRRELLMRLQTHVVGKITDQEDLYGQAFNEAHKKLTRKHRDYLKSEPVSGSAWIDEQAENDETVSALREQIAPLEDVLSTLKSLYHRAGQNTALTFRQREVYEQLN